MARDFFEPFFFFQKGGALTRIKYHIPSSGLHKAGVTRAKKKFSEMLLGRVNPHGMGTLPAPPESSPIWRPLHHPSLQRRAGT
jgi:hypothetical protein